MHRVGSVAAAAIAVFAVVIAPLTPGACVSPVCFSMKSSPNFTKLYLRATNQKTPAPNLLLAGNPACDQD
jgi:hypothetical protein